MANDYIYKILPYLIYYKCYLPMFFRNINFDVTWRKCPLSKSHGLKIYPAVLEIYFSKPYFCLHFPYYIPLFIDHNFSLFFFFFFFGGGGGHMKALRPRTLCAKFDQNWSRGSRYYMAHVHPRKFTHAAQRTMTIATTLN